MPSDSKSRSSAPGRLAFLDWTRGMAVLIMLQGHVFHAFSRNDLRDKGPYLISQLFGGEGPAIFLFLTGITLAFLIDRRQRQGLGPREKWMVAIRRSAYLWTLAFLFRCQLWLFAYPGSNWTDLFKVDILNCMGFAIALFSVTALLTTQQRVKVCALLGTAIAVASPLVSAADWSWLPAQVSAYFVPNYAAFAFFPWASFLAFGMSAGSILRLSQPEDMPGIMLSAAVGGVVLVGAGEYFSNAPYSLYPSSEFWLNGPGLVTIKLGVILLSIAFAWLWCEHIHLRTSIARQLGTTSLIVYWVHIELVYGRWLGIWRESFTAAQCAVAALAVIGLMVCVSLARSDWPGLAKRMRFRLPALLLPAASTLKSQRAAGD